MSRYAVITGASSGLGACFARQLARRGYDLVLVARRKERLQKLAAKIKKHYGVETEILAADLSSREACRRVLRAVEDLPVEILINNAGFGDCGSFLETELGKELQMIDVNVTAVHVLTKGMLKRFVKQNRGYILNVASSAGLFPAGPYMATYYATKAYVTSFTRAIAQELKEKGSKVYIGALCPGPVDTEFNDVAEVEFALKGISPKYCVQYGLNQMFARKTVIVPTLYMKMVTLSGRLFPQDLVIRMTGGQQKRKLGKR